MRTKALLLTAAMSAAGIASSLGQGTVYSVNAVGFINLTIPTGYSLIANQLNGTNNNINTILPLVPETTQLFKWDATSQAFGEVQEFVGDGWYDVGGNPSATTLGPGDAAFVFNQGMSFTATLVGEVPQGSALTVNLVTGYNMLSSVVPQQAGLNQMGFPTIEGLQYFVWESASANYGPILEYVADPGAWFDAGGNEVVPTPAVGQGFFIFNQGGPFAWTRSFSVNQ